MQTKSILTTTFLIATLLFSETSFAQWQYVGGQSFYNHSSEVTGLLVDKNNVPYISFFNTDSAVGYVMKFNGTAWVTVGSPFQTYCNLAMDSASGTPYVVFQDNGGFSVEAFNGTAWDTVGPSGSAPGSALVVVNGVAYIAFIDDPQGGGLSVQKYTGGSWNYVGSPSFSDAGIGISPNSFCADHSGNLLISYGESAGGGSVQKFNGSSWALVGTADFSPGGGGYGIAVDNSNTPYIAFADNNTTNTTLSVMKFNGTSWAFVGPEGTLQDECGSVSFTIDNLGTPYAAYYEGTNYKGNVMAYKNSSWSFVGGHEFTPEAEFIRVATSADGYVYAAFSPSQTSVDVMRISKSATAISETNAGLSVHVAPNPGNGVFEVQLNLEEAAELELSVYDMMGRRIWYEKPSGLLDSYHTNINISNAAAGIYFLKLNHGSGFETVKIELQK